MPFCRERSLRVKRGPSSWMPTFFSFLKMYLQEADKILIQCYILWGGGVKKKMHLQKKSQNFKIKLKMIFFFSSAFLIEKHNKKKMFVSSLMLKFQPSFSERSFLLLSLCFFSLALTLLHGSESFLKPLKKDPVFGTKRDVRGHL